MGKERRAVTVSDGWRQFSLFPREEVRRLTRSRRARIEARLEKEKQMSDRDRINQRIVLRDHEDNEAQWAVHYRNDGLDLIRPAARMYIPYEMCEPIARALLERPVASPEPNLGARGVKSDR